MPRIQVKSLDERFATAGIHMGGGPERRKLEPFEVVDVAEDLVLPNGINLLDLLWATGKVELTMDPPTRPLDYATQREAVLCSPNFKPRGPNEERERDAALAAVAERLEQTAPDPIVKSEAPAEKPTQPARRRRSAKRALENARLKDGETLSA